MDTHQYRKMASSPLRGLLGNMIADHDQLPTRTELRRQIDEAVGDDVSDAIKGRIYKRAVELAEAGQDRKARFTLRQEADQSVLAFVEEIEAADKLVAAPAGEPVDGELVDRVAGEANRDPGYVDLSDVSEKTNAAERLRTGGVP